MISNTPTVLPHPCRAQALGNGDPVEDVLGDGVLGDGDLGEPVLGDGDARCLEQVSLSN